MSWEALTRVGLPVREYRVVFTTSDGTEITDQVTTGETIIKEPGDTITREEMMLAGQSKEDVAALVKSKAIKENKTTKEKK